MADTATTLSFFYNLMGIPSSNEPASVVFNKLGPVVITCSKNGVLGVHPQRPHDMEEEEIGECGRMEDLASAVVKLLGDLKSCDLLGPLFLTVMGRLKMVLENESLSANGCDTAREDEQAMKDSPSVLLEWEAKRSMRHESTSSSIMVLYVVAAVCEQMGSELLEQVDTISLLPVLAGVVGCHARCLKPSTPQQLLGASPVELTGGPVTLSITLGLLSAILAQKSEV